MVCQCWHPCFGCIESGGAAAALVGVVAGAAVTAGVMKVKNLSDEEVADEN